MKINFKDPGPKNGLGRNKYAEFYEELKKYPNRWAKMEKEYKSAGVAIGFNNNQNRNGFVFTTRRNDNGTYSLYAKFCNCVVGKDNLRRFVDQVKSDYVD